MKYENEHKNWILEGFPRTKNQALNLQRIGIIPDKFILLNVEHDASVERIKKVMIDEGTTLIGSDLDDASESAMHEYDLHIKGVKDSYSKFIYEVDVNKTLEDMEQDLLKMVKIKINDPMRPPRIIILGPPGSGRSTQARNIAQKYGIVHVSVMDLLKEEIGKKTSRGNQIADDISKGNLVSSLTVISLVENRLKQSDCYVNGWIMDGFPKTVEQVSLLTQMNIVPTKVVILECRQEVCIERLNLKRIDPVSGYLYNLADQAPDDDEVMDRLVVIDGNDEETVKRRWHSWDEFVGKIEEIFSN
jgi:adenylate kinase